MSTSISADVKPKPKRKKWLVIFSLATGISLLGWFSVGLFFRPRNSESQMQLVTVTESTVADKITGESGTLKFASQRTLKTAVPGTVETILVQAGEQVIQGQPLVRLEDEENRLRLDALTIDLEEINLKIQSQQFNLRQARQQQDQLAREYEITKNNQDSSLNKLRQTKNIEFEQQKIEVTRKEQQLRSAMEELADSKIKLEEDLELIQKGFISENDLRDRQKEVAQKTLEVENIRDELRLRQIELQQIDGDRQELNSTILQGLSEPQKALRELENQLIQATQAYQQAELEFNQILREKRQIEIDQAKTLTELEQSTISAPSDGVVLEIKVKVEDFVEEKAEIILVGNPNQKVVEFQLNPLDATKVKPNQKAEAALIGVDAEKITGEVSNISLLAGDSQNNSSSGNAPAKITATVILDPTEEQVFPGTPVSIDIILDQKEDVLNVPNESVNQNEEGEYFVWLKDEDNKAQKQTVEIGLEGLLNTEIITGLESEDVVIIPSLEFPLTEGTAIPEIET